MDDLDAPIPKTIKLNRWNGLSLRVIALFITAMIISFSPEFLRGFFADHKVDVNSWGFHWDNGFIDRDWNWGYRHYLYFFMCVALFVIQVVRMWMWVDKYKDEFKP